MKTYKSSKTERLRSSKLVNLTGKGGDIPFGSYRNDLYKIFPDIRKLVKNVEDFWLFVEKYEAVNKKKIELHGATSSNVDPSDLISLEFAISDEQIFSKIPFHDETYGVPTLSRERVKEFSTIFLTYLDFKFKENSKKLSSLLKAQTNLPVFQYKDEIIESVSNERVIIVAGDTGCGKSTQVPQYLMKAGFSRIACTQPRRIACISLCKRVAYETLNEYGSEIGYQIRFEKSRRQDTKVTFITEGLLLRQAASDNSLSNYDVIVLDEVHERHLHGDFLLGVLKCLLHQRDDFKLILMSATININLFSDYFGGNAKVIQVPGRLHPIQVNFRPIEDYDKGSKKEKLDPAPYLRILQIIDQKYPKEERGDVLMFLSGMSEITTVVDAANAYNEKVNKWIILPLHSSLSIAEQDKVFDYPPEGIRKCVVSTNIAETSITIDGIRFVVDSGMVKEMSYDPVCKMQRLKEFWISKASAEQRKGRAGRTGPGVCYRLYSEADYESLQPYTTPEIQRVPLDSVLLQMVAMGLPDSRKFPFVEPPPSESIENAILSLKQHGALSENEKLTSMGQMLSKLPVDIPLGKMLVMGSMFHQIEPVLSLAAALSVQSPFTNRAYRDSECETTRKELESDHGDPITLLNALKAWLEVKSSRNYDRGGSRKWCKRRGFEEQRFYEMVKLRTQFKDLLKDCGLLKSESRPTESMSSAERALRHGEIKLLRNMKRNHANEAPRKKKILKPDTWQIEDDDNNKEVDIKDIDFRLSNNQVQLENLVSSTSACSYRDLTMLKAILCSGLYPQISVPDEFNHCKGVGEQLFHTQGKPFVFLHPLSFFGNHPQIIQLQESDIVEAPGFSHKRPLSSKHQLLSYMSLLETSKPFLVNTMRMPATQTLLLFSNKVHTNNNFTRIICDSWIELKFPTHPPIEKLMLRVINLRAKWDLLLKLRLEDSDCAKLEQELTNGLVEFMKTEIVYSIKKLLPADLKEVYTGPNGYNLEGINPLLPDTKLFSNSEIGGVQLTSYLTYNCLDDDSVSNESWECPNCGMFAPLIVLEKWQHLHICKGELFEGEKKDTTENKLKPNSKSFYCEACKTNLNLTPIEILKHKKSHC